MCVICTRTATKAVDVLLDESRRVQKRTQRPCGKGRPWLLLQLNAVRNLRCEREGDSVA